MNIKTVTSFIVVFALGIAVAMTLQDNSKTSGVSNIEDTQIMSVQEDIRVPGAALFEAQNAAIEQINVQDNVQMGRGDFPKGTPQQDQLYKDILTNIQDANFVQEHTLEEVYAQMAALTLEQQEQLIETGRSLLAQGKLDLKLFKQTEIKRYQTIAEGAPLPTPEQQSQYEQLSNNLSDPGFNQGMTYSSFITDIENLPPALKQEMADRLAMMIEKGEIDPGRFLGEAYAGRDDIKFFFR